MKKTFGKSIESNKIHPFVTPLQERLKRMIKVYCLSQSFVLLMVSDFDCKCGSTIEGFYVHANTPT